MSDPKTPEELAQALKTQDAAEPGKELLVSTACPKCEVRFALLVHYGLALDNPQPLLGGSTLKFGAHAANLFRCVECGVEFEGELK